MHSSFKLVAGSRPEIASRRRSVRVRCAYSKVPVVVGVVVGASVVVVAGEAAAWAGTITDLTTGLTQRSGKTSGLNEPPPNAICKMRRRSTVMVEDPPLARSMRRPQNIPKISDCAVPFKP